MKIIHKIHIEKLIIFAGICTLLATVLLIAANPARIVLAQTGDNKIYLPIIDKPPAPSPSLYYENFSKNNSGWRQRTSGSCMALYQDKTYGTFTKADRECEWPAPPKAEHTYGTFQVQAREINTLPQSNSDAVKYGIYINRNSNGYYLFKVDIEEGKKDCAWKLIKYTSSKSETLLNGSCKSANKGYSQYNTLKIKHINTGELSVYLNNNHLGTTLDKGQLTGQGTGLYIEEDSKEGDVIIGFDNFTVNRP
jgi:hypothetical protein